MFYSLRNFTRHYFSYRQHLFDRPLEIISVIFFISYRQALAQYHAVDKHMTSFSATTRSVTGDSANINGDSSVWCLRAVMLSLVRLKTAGYWRGAGTYRASAIPHFLRVVMG